jgi:Tfp pilus assembly protein PilN
MLDVTGAQAAQPQPTAQPKANLASIDDSSHLQEIMPALLVLIMAAATLVVFLLGRSNATQAQRSQIEYGALMGELSVAPYSDIAAQANQISSSLRVLRRLNQKELIWSKLLQNLQLTTQTGITLSSLSVDTKNTLKLEGQADSFDSVAKYLATLRASSLIAEADLLSAQLADTGNGRVNFSFDLKFKPEQLQTTITPLAKTSAQSPVVTPAPSQTGLPVASNPTPVTTQSATVTPSGSVTITANPTAASSQGAL